MIKIKRGLNLPIAGEPEAVIDSSKEVTSVAVVGFDYVGMKPTMLVQVGDKVAKGQAVFEDKKTPGVIFTAPAAGTVTAINRGAKRVFQSLVIALEGNEEVSFEKFEANKLASLERQQVVDNLVNSGLWTALRTRPFSRIPAIGSTPAAIFVNAMDTNPLAADPQIVIAQNKDSFAAGLDVLSRLGETVYACHAAGTDLPKAKAANVRYETFQGPHPAGLTGTHIHFLRPASAERVVWTVNYQDVIAIGQLFTSGKLNNERVIALAGPAVNKPRLIKTQLGADLNELTAGELQAGDNRVISGSVLAGRQSEEALNYLGRYHLQVSVLAEGGERQTLGWISPGPNKFSNLNIYLSRFMPSKKFNFTTTTNGSPRAMVPVGSNYESVMPLDILPTQLLRALIVSDLDEAIALGALELDEEDLGLCTYICPSKYEYGAILRDNLTLIEKEG